MRRTVGCLLAALAIACRPAPPDLTDEDRTAIRAVTDSFMSWSHVGNDSAVASLYTPTGVLMPPNAPVVEGRAAIRAFFEQYPPMPDFILSNTEIDGRGDLVYVRGTYSFSLPAQGRTPAMTDRGKFIEIRRRQPDGRWLLQADIFNSDIPLPTPTPARR